jgi:hypothetical protein
MNHVFIGVVIYFLLTFWVVIYFKRLIYWGSDTKEFKKELIYLATLPTKKNLNDLKSKSIDFYEWRLLEVRFLYLRLNYWGFIFSRIKGIDSNWDIYTCIVSKEELSLYYICNSLINKQYILYAGWNKPDILEVQVVFATKFVKWKTIKLIYEINGMCLYKKQYATDLFYSPII